jgi:hypothetical protein
MLQNIMQGLGVRQILWNDVSDGQCPRVLKLGILGLCMSGLLKTVVRKYRKTVG